MVIFHNWTLVFLEWYEVIHRRETDEWDGWMKMYVEADRVPANPEHSWARTKSCEAPSPLWTTQGQSSSSNNFSSKRSKDKGPASIRANLSFRNHGSNGSGANGSSSVASVRANGPGWRSRKLDSIVQQARNSEQSIRWWEIGSQRSLEWLQNIVPCSFDHPERPWSAPCTLPWTCNFVIVGGS